MQKKYLDIYAHDFEQLLTLQVAHSQENMGGKIRKIAEDIPNKKEQGSLMGCDFLSLDGPFFIT